MQTLDTGADRKRELLGRLPGRSRQPCSTDEWNARAADVIAIEPHVPVEAWQASTSLRRICSDRHRYAGSCRQRQPSTAMPTVAQSFEHPHGLEPLAIS